MVSRRPLAKCGFSITIRYSCPLFSKNKKLKIFFISFTKKIFLIKHMFLWNDYRPLGPRTFDSKFSMYSFKSVEFSYRSECSEFLFTNRRIRIGLNYRNFQKHVNFAYRIQSIAFLLVDFLEVIRLLDISLSIILRFTNLWCRSLRINALARAEIF